MVGTNSLYGKRTVGFFSLASHALRACKAHALRACKTLRARFTDFFTDFEKKKNDCFAVYSSVAFHPARNLRQAATKERLTTKKASINGSCSLNFVELSHSFLFCFFFPILSWQTLLSLFIPMAFLSKKKMLSGGLKIILRPFDKAYIKGTQSAMWPHWPGHYFCQFEKRLPQPEIKSTRQIHLEIRFSPA